MEKLKRFIRYLLDCIFEAHDRTEKGMKALAALLLLGSIFGRWISPTIPILGTLRDPSITELCERSFAVFAVGYILIWVPFKRNDALKEDHARQVIEVTKPITDALVKCEEKLRPQLKISCNMGISACSVTARSSHCHYFRVVVENIAAHQGIDMCVGHLVSVEKDGAVVRDHERDALPFSPSQNADSLSKTILAGNSETLDVLVVGFGSPRQEVMLSKKGGDFSVLETKEGHPAIKDPGEYVLTVAVSGNGVPKETGRLKFKWTGDHESSEISLIG